MVTSRIWFTAAQKAELWERWKNGQSAAAISRALKRKNKTGVERVRHRARRSGGTILFYFVKALRPDRDLGAVGRQAELKRLKHERKIGRARRN